MATIYSPRLRRGCTDSLSQCARVARLRVALSAFVAGFLALASGSEARAYQVQLNIQDQTGAPLDARIHSYDAAGVHYPGGPDGDLLSHRDPWMRGHFYPGSSVTMEVAHGAAQFIAARGFEYKPASITPNVQSDTTFTMVVRRYFNMASLGWFGGDVHAHSAHAPSDYDVSPEDVLRVAKVEGISMAWMLDGALEFTGAPHAVSTPEHIIYYSTEYRNQACGHVSLLGLRPSSIGSNCCSPPNPVYPLLSQLRENWAPTWDQAMVLCHPVNGGGFFDEQGWPAWGLGREAPILATSGNLDAYDIASFGNLGEIQYDDWYGLLNSGIRVPASAGTDAMVNHYWNRPFGSYRVYVKCDTLTAGDWVAGLRAGRTFVTNYPLIPEFTVQGAGAGSTVQIAAPDSVIAIHFKIQSVLPASTAEIIINGEVFREIALPQGGVIQSVIGDHFVRLEKSAWIALRVSGTTTSRSSNSHKLFAHTSPVYVEIAGEPIRRTNKAAHFIDWADSLRIFVERRGNWPSQAVRTSVHNRINQSEAYFRALFHAPPDSCHLMEPGVGDTVNATLPFSFVWSQARDVEEGDRVSYRFEVRALNTSSPLVSFVTSDTSVVTEFQEVGAHEWRVTAIDLGNHETECASSWRLIVFDPAVAAIPSPTSQPAVTLDPPWCRPRPVPFAAELSLGLAQPLAEGERIEIYDLLGRSVTSLDEPGEVLVWDGRDRRGNPVPSGTYWLRLLSPDLRRSRSEPMRVVLLR